MQTEIQKDLWQRMRKRAAVLRLEGRTPDADLIEQAALAISEQQRSVELAAAGAKLIAKNGQLRALVEREIPFARAEGRKTWVADAFFALSPDDSVQGLATPSPLAQAVLDKVLGVNLGMFLVAAVDHIEKGGNYASSDMTLTDGTEVDVRISRRMAIEQPISKRVTIPLELAQYAHEVLSESGCPEDGYEEDCHGCIMTQRAKELLGFISAAGETGAAGPEKPGHHCGLLKADCTDEFCPTHGRDIR